MVTKSAQAEALPWWKMKDSRATYTIAGARAWAFTRLPANDQASVPLHSTVVELTTSDMTHALRGDSGEKEPGNPALSDFMNKEMMYPPFQKLQNKLERLCVKAYV